MVSLLLTPGPTNTLLASSGIQVGIRKSFRLIPAEAFGYLISITVWGIIIGTVSRHYPIIPTLLKLFSAAYILFLAIKLWKTADVEESFNQPTIRARELFLATLFESEKLCFFASAIFPAVVWTNVDAYMAHMLVFLILIIPICIFLDFYWFDFWQPIECAG